MKVLHLNAYDQKGGAAKAVYRLHKGLLQAGVHSGMLVRSKVIREREIHGPRNLFASGLNRMRPYLDYLLPFLQIRKRTTFFPALVPDSLNSRIRRLAPDLVHLHWISEGFIRLESLASIPRPKIWTLHDMWAFTGGCHYAGDCPRYLDHCGECPILRSGREKDLSWKVFERKLRTYENIHDLVVTTPSRWLADEVKKSPLMQHFEVRIIPNGLDTSIFKPRDRRQARLDFHMDPDKTYILFGAIQPEKNKLKGFDLLARALNNIHGKEVVLLVFGDKSFKPGRDLPFPVKSVGWIGNEDQLSRLYSSANLMVVPSIQEAFGQTATEAMACGTPVVAFGATGPLDIVIHGETGYLARPFDPEDLAQGITWILESPERQQYLSAQARKRAIGHFDIRRVAEQFVHLYEERVR